MCGNPEKKNMVLCHVTMDTCVTLVTSENPEVRFLVLNFVAERGLSCPNLRPLVVLVFPFLFKTDTSGIFQLVANH
jgi:hypothetical protein